MLTSIFIPTHPSVLGVSTLLQYEYNYELTISMPPNYVSLFLNLNSVSLSICQRRGVHFYSELSPTKSMSDKYQSKHLCMKMNSKR